MTRVLFAAAAFASLVACTTPNSGYSSASAIPFSVSSNEGTYVDPLSAPHQLFTSMTSSGIPGDSGEGHTSSAFH